MLAAAKAYEQELYSKSQTAVLTGGGKAVVCEIDAPVVVGDGTEQNPEVGQLRKIHMFMCMNCGVLFAKEYAY